MRQQDLAQTSNSWLMTVPDGWDGRLIGADIRANLQPVRRGRRPSRRCHHQPIVCKVLHAWQLFWSILRRPIKTGLSCVDETGLEIRGCSLLHARGAPSG